MDLRNKRVKVARGVVRAGGEFIVGPPKSDAGVRDVAIPPHLVPMVKKHLADHTAAGADALLFPAAADSDAHMAPSTLYKVYYPARKAAGRPDLRWHDLRHTGAVLAAQTGATLAELMGRLGHSTPGAAMRYQHAAADRDAEIAKRLSKLARRS
ncbi:MAG: tyrosine-type recombinase/integrase [Nostocoides sp.]